MKLSQRLKRLEERIVPTSGPTIITIQYIWPDKEVTGSRTVELDQRVQFQLEAMTRRDERWPMCCGSDAAGDSRKRAVCPSKRCGSISTTAELSGLTIAAPTMPPSYGTRDDSVGL